MSWAFCRAFLWLSGLGQDSQRLVYHTSHDSCPIVPRWIMIPNPLPLLSYTRNLDVDALHNHDIILNSSRLLNVDDIIRIITDLPVSNYGNIGIGRRFYWKIWDDKRSASQKKKFLSFCAVDLLQMSLVIFI